MPTKNKHSLSEHFSVIGFVRIVGDADDSSAVEKNTCGLRLFARRPAASVVVVGVWCYVFLRALLPVSVRLSLSSE